MDTKAMEPYGQALLDYSRGDTSATIRVHRDDGHADDLPAAVFFRQAPDFSPLEQEALTLCRGHVMDVGAGTGRHSLALQERGLQTLAIDVSPQAVQIMSMQGVRHCQQADIFEFRGGPIDTLLLMMHGIGLVGDLDGLDRFLLHAARLLQPGGQLLLDSLDVRYTGNREHLAYHEANRRAGRYFGQIRIRFEYKGLMGPYFNWLHVDPETLAHHAERTGWSCEVVRLEDSGDYLARLTLMQR